MEVRPLTPALRVKAENELNETQSSIAANIKIIREWMQQQPHLQAIQPTDQWLIAFLRGCKHNLEKCKKKVDMYYTLKGTVPEIYSNRDPFDNNIQDILKLGVFLPLKENIREDSPRLCISRAGPFCASSQLPMADFMKVSIMILEILLLEDDNLTICGEDIISDLNGLGLRLLWQWTPTFVKKITAISEKALSVRVKSLHIINAPYGIGGAIALFKMFLGTKIKERIFSHSKNTLYDHIDKSILPEDYGGTCGTVQELIDHWKTKVESYREWFLDETAFADESKRPVSGKTFGFFRW